MEPQRVEPVAAARAMDDVKIDTYALRLNLQQLRDSLDRLWGSLVCQGITEGVRRINQVLWRLNRPLTAFNRWVADQCKRAQRLEKRERSEAELEHALSRMEDEGPVPSLAPPKHAHQ